MCAPRRELRTQKVCGAAAAPRYLATASFFGILLLDGLIGKDGGAMRTIDGFRRGINLGGWLSQCSHEKAHYDSFITEEDIRTISSWGLDHVRLPIDYELIETAEGETKEDGCNYIDACVSWCKKHGLRMIIDLHKTAGYSFNDAFGDANSLFCSEALQSRFVNLWERLAARYANEQDTVVFELLNEIVEEENSGPWNALAKRAVEARRKYAPGTPIIIGGIQWNSVRGVKLLDVPNDDNVVYTFHFYEPFAFTHQKAYWVAEMPKDFGIGYPATMEEYRRAYDIIGEKAEQIFRSGCTNMGAELLEAMFMEAIEAAEQKGAALYCGEYGVIDQAPAEDSVRWYRDMHRLFEKHGIGRAAWTYKEMDFGITMAHYAGVREELIGLL